MDFLTYERTKLRDVFSNLFCIFKVLTKKGSMGLRILIKSGRNVLMMDF